ncbi:MAG: hypothetical protein MUO37_04890 [Methyloceanibacter sp.]|nr:hypothetical protein [Methyloceanibacter sp.]
MSATLVGYIGPSAPSVVAKSNLVVRFFTPNTHTEVARSCSPTASATAHLTNDTTNVVTSGTATDQTTLNTLLNEIKADYNAHIASTTFHSNADIVNVITSADSSSEATAVTLANEIKADYNAHRLQATIHPYSDNRNETTSPNASGLATAITLANEIKADYNGHRVVVAGVFTIYAIVPGTYDVGIKSDSSLSLLVEDVVFTEGVTTTVNFGLNIQGDVNFDDYCDSGDAGIVAGNNGKVGACVSYGGTWLMPPCPAQTLCYGYVL